MFNGMTIHVLPLGLGKKRLALFEGQIVKHGGKIVSNLNQKNVEAVTHFVIEAEGSATDMKDMYEEFKNIQEGSLFLKTEWLSESLKTKEIVDVEKYKILVKASASTNATTIGSPSSYAKRKLEEVEYSSPLKLLKAFDSKISSPSQASSSRDSCENPNKLITDELQKLANAFRCNGDQWRNFSYTRAVGAIKSYGKEITSYEEALKIPGLGDKMASKVWELLETGTLRRTQEVCGTEKAATLALFNGVWGVGPAIAQQWYVRGWRTLEDLHSKALLTRQQEVGLKHYDDIQAKIPREEVEEITMFVSREAQALYPELLIETCGSYRRGKHLCGDIDIVMSHPDENLTATLLTPLVQTLKDSGFITDDLVTLEVSGSHRKYYGMCRLPGEGRRHRRLDLFVFPWNERGPALLHYTGSAMFNRSLRLLALHKDMSLSEHALHAGVVRQGGQVVSEGTRLSTPTEESVFEHLGIMYRPPHDREEQLPVA